jgi:predicted ATP-dependent endonuclease of OLD family
MRLDKLSIKNFRKLEDCEVSFRDTTFLIGSNNAGKSSVFRALDCLHRNINVSSEDYSRHYDPVIDDEVKASEIEIIGEYHNVPDDANNWVGFKGRVINNKTPAEGETNNMIVYRKLWKLETGKAEIYLKEYTKTRSTKYLSATTPRELIGDDFSLEYLTEYFGKGDLDNALTHKNNKEKYNELPPLWDVDTEKEATWVKNPGGIPGNVLSKLPKVIIIPAESCITELTGQNGALLNLLSDLFTDVRKKSPNYTQAQIHLAQLAKEMDPQDVNTEFGKLMSQLNTMAHNLFPNTSVHVSASLDDGDKSIKPSFSVEMESNIKTPVSYQGHGMIRTTAFQLLRFIQNFLNREVEYPRRTILCFEEPELFLHPAAANQLRDALYDFAGENHQIVATTHSPYMVNLGTDKKVSLTKFSISKRGFSATKSFNLEKAFLELRDDEKQNLKMLLKVDDYISRLFFTNKCIFVEGDTEEVVIRETLKRLPQNEKSIVIGNCELLRARGKAVLISLAKYLNALDVNYIFMHDRDKGTEKAEAMNPLILAVTGQDRRIMVEECIEDILGYEAPTRDKPYKAHKHIEDNWLEDFDNLPENWKDIFIKLHAPYLDHLAL